MINVLQNFLLQFLGMVGRFTQARLTFIGSYVNFIRQTLTSAIRGPLRLRLIFKQLEFVGNQSLNIVLMTGFFTGAVFGLQIGGIFRIFRADALLGGATAKALALELSPLMVGFLLSGRAGSAITAEIATMKVGEQVTAMEAMAVDPVSYLVVPRVIACIIVIPLLVVVFSFIGTIGAYVVGVLIFNVDQGVFIEKITFLVDMVDIRKGIFKAYVFSVVIGVTACRTGLLASGGAKGVGVATTNAVVLSLLVILVCDFVITYVQFYF